MTNHSTRPYHKICGLRPEGSQAPYSTFATGSRSIEESGYTLVALLAVMTLLGLFALAAAPGIRQQVQREREKEAIFRGEQVADAIRDYYIYRANTLRVAGDQGLPSSMDQLLEGIPVPGGSKKRQILRASAARDPLSSNGEWRLIRPRSQELIDFEQSIIAYAGTLPPTTGGQQLTQLQQFAIPQLTGVLNTGTTESAPGGETSSDDYSGPFVGVASRSRTNSVIYYYAIDRHDQWIFTPLFR
jgi:type II secretory pathway pseudopilin PulG